MRKTKITKTNYFTNMTDHDQVAELAVILFGLDRKNRKQEVIDTKQAFVRWWYKNSKRCKKYKTLASISRLMNMNHASIIHLKKKRKPTLDYSENSAEICEFLKIL